MATNQKTMQHELALEIRNAKPGESPITTPLTTSDRVIRRVTDGIYREPWAALRELISNAYDADATTVTISTDAPRFRRLTISDDGNGFTAEALASMCSNIGGSQKRTSNGAYLGITKKGSPDLSPQGRRLIGKLGIGLFAVSQLTQRFRILTKVRGEATRTLAEISLFRNVEGKRDREESDASGEARISKIPASDVDAHGTSIVIEELLPRTKEEFRSRDTWDLVLSATDDPEDADEVQVQRPEFHIGFAKPELEHVFLERPNVPWQDEDSPELRFRKLVQSFHDHAEGLQKPSLANTFDNYFRFVWYLSLSAPLDYVDKHPFDLGADSGVRFFVLGQRKKGQATEIVLKAGETLRTRLGLKAPERGKAGKFRVLFDGLELKRPIRFTGLPPTDNAIKSPLMFVGSEAPDMRKYDERKTGGALRFEGYLLWYPKIVPTDHVGVLVRVGDASGSLFDPTFMKYQVSEQTRREQVMSEIFVHDGMDAALNIDRESFNHSHPHYQYVAGWVHDAFKQFATKHKAIGAELRREGRSVAQQVALTHIERVTVRAIGGWSRDRLRPIPVAFVESGEPRPRSKSSIVLTEDVVLAGLSKGTRQSAGRVDARAQVKAKLAAVMQILAAAGLLQRLSERRIERLAADIASVLFSEAE